MHQKPSLIPVSGIRIAKARAVRGLSADKLALRVGMDLKELQAIEPLVAAGVTPEVFATLCVELRRRGEGNHDGTDGCVNQNKLPATAAVVS